MNNKYSRSFRKSAFILFIILTGCITKKDENACDNICPDFFATNYGNCESCTYSKISFYARIPRLIQISEDSTTPKGTDTIVTKIAADTINYWEVVPADTPFTLNLGNKTNFLLHKLIVDSINACIETIPGVVTYSGLADSTLSWVAISKNGNKIFTGTVRADPSKECITIEVNKKKTP